MEDKHEEVEETESSSGDSFIDDESYDDEPSTSGQDEGLHLEASCRGYSCYQLFFLSLS